MAVALGVAWRSKLDEQAAIDAPAKPLAVAPAAGSASAATAPAIVAPAQGQQSAAPPAAPQSAVMVPSFDVARIGPDGRAVIAGRSAPGAKIVLLNGGKEIARAEADPRGEWVVIVQDPPLRTGQHELRVVQHIEGRAPVTSEQSVVAIVPEEPTVGSGKSREETLVMIAPPAGAARLVQSSSPAGQPRSGDLALSTLDYDDRGHVTVTGQAAPGTVVRAYINDRMVAEGAAGPDGHWRLAPPETIPHGKHRLRLDRVARDGKPVARLELPFDHVAMPPASGTDRRLHVVRGDNLWNISRAHYGDGRRFTVVFGANKEQIRDPHLIYPGQIFSLPKVN